MNDISVHFYKHIWHYLNVEMCQACFGCKGKFKKVFLWCNMLIYKLLKTLSVQQSCKSHLATPWSTLCTRKNLWSMTDNPEPQRLKIIIWPWTFDLLTNVHSHPLTSPTFSITSKRELSWKMLVFFLHLCGERFQSSSSKPKGNQTDWLGMLFTHLRIQSVIVTRNQNFISHIFQMFFFTISKGLQYLLFVIFVHKSTGCPVFSRCLTINKKISYIPQTITGFLVSFKSCTHIDTR